MWLLLLAGCYSQATFDENIDGAVCEWANTCFGAPDTTVGSYDYCLDEARETEPVRVTACSYKHTKARSCVREIRHMQCPTTAEPVRMPSVCDLVWDCG